MAGRLQLGLSRLRSEVGRILLASPASRRREEEARRREEEGRKRRKTESTHPLFRAEESRRRAGPQQHAPLAQSCSVPVQGRRRGGGEEEGRRAPRRGHAPVGQTQSLPSLPGKARLRRAGGSGGCPPHRTFPFDDGQSSLSSVESDLSEHIYEEIRDNTEEDEEQESFLLAISLERRNNLKLYGCADWDFQPSRP